MLWEYFWLVVPALVMLFVLHRVNTRHIHSRALYAMNLYKGRSKCFDCDRMISKERDTYLSRLYEVQPPATALLGRMGD